MKPIYLMIAAAPLIAACADSGANYTPILDGTPTAAFQADLAECQNLARTEKQLGRQAATAAALGAGAGAVLGELDEDGDAAGGAIAGALAGGAASAVDVAAQQKSIVIECLRGRGHRVVG